MSTFYEDLKAENEEALRILLSDDWKVYRKFIQNRTLKFQVRVNDAVASGDLLEARVQLALLNEYKNLVEVFQQQTAEIKKASSKGVNSNGK